MTTYHITSFYIRSRRIFAINNVLALFPIISSYTLRADFCGNISRCRSSYGVEAVLCYKALPLNHRFMMQSTVFIIVRHPFCNNIITTLF